MDYISTSKDLAIVVQFSSVQLLNRVQFFATPWAAACQTSLSITNSQSLPKLMSIELVMPSNRLILCRPLLLLPSVFPSIRVFSNESALHIRWSKYWSFSFNICPSKEHPGPISHPYMTFGKTIALTIQTCVGKVMSLPFNMLSSNCGGWIKIKTKRQTNVFFKNLISENFVNSA